MKKISRKDLQGLRRQFPVLSKEDMKGCVGGYGDGYSGGGDDWFDHGFGGYDPDGNFHWYSGYTQEELDNWEGEWPGGWVYGLGYVNPEYTYTVYEKGNYWKDGVYVLPPVTIYGNMGGGNYWYNGTYILPTVFIDGEEKYPGINRYAPSDPTYNLMYKSGYATGYERGLSDDSPLDDAYSRIIWAGSSYVPIDHAGGELDSQKTWFSSGFADGYRAAQKKRRGQ